MYRLTSFVLGSALTLTVATAQQVRVDYDHGADFARYHTFTWGKVQASPSISQLAEERIMAQIEETLAKKGLRRQETGGDLVVTYQAAVKQQVQLTTFSSGGPGWGWGPGFGGGISTTTADRIPIGTLVVDLLDPQAKQLIFRGIASDTVSDKPEKNAKKLAKAMDKMFEKYPPKT